MPKPMDQVSPEPRAVIEAVFPNTAKNVAEHRCPVCKATIDPARDFRTTLSEKEYYLSGLCQNCQDRLFA